MVSMTGFEKLDLSRPIDETTTPNNTTQEPMKKTTKSHKVRNTSIGFVGGIVIVIGILILAVALPAIRVAAQAKAAYAQAKKVIDAAKHQNIQLASDELTKTRKQVIATQTALHQMGYANFIPLVNWYYQDADHGIKAALYGLDAGRTLVDSLLPYTDLLGLKGQGTFTGGTASQRIQTAVKTFAKVVPQIDTISGSLIQAQKEIDQINPNHYPPFLGGEKIRANITTLKKTIDETTSFTTEAAPLVKVLPDILGEPKGKEYMILFQNDKELRPTGGFLTAYSLMRIEQGVLHPDSAADIYSLDATIPNKPAAPRIIKQYLPKVPELNLRDTNISPDFVTSMDLFNQLYKKSSQYHNVDGIIAVDTNPLVDAINIMGGEITVNGTTYSTKIDKRCDCPQVIYEMEVSADQPVGYIKNNRKGFISDLMFAIMNKALSSSPKMYWGPLFQAMLTNTTQKHILFDLYNPDAQRGLAALNATGQIKAFDGDYLHINDANYGGAKSNQFTTEAVTENYDIKSDGTITKTVTINYKNPFPPSDCNLERGGLCLNAILRNLLRIYVPKGSQLISSQGSEVKMMTYDELGKTVFEGFLTVRPQGAATFTITYQLPFKLAKNSPLPALIQKQPGTYATDYIINVNGHKQMEFPLDQDKTIKINP